MKLIHWTKQNNTVDILKNGIRPNRRKSITEENEDIKGVWCYPFTRNKSLNNNWKSNLKTWRLGVSNFNGFVFKLQDSDFPIYAGDFSLIACYPRESLYQNREEFVKDYGKYFSPKEYALELNEESIEEGWIDYQDFEIIIPHRIDGKRIEKVIKDRNPKKNNL